MKHISEIGFNPQVVKEPKRLHNPGIPESCYNKRPYRFNPEKTAFTQRPDISRFKLAYKRNGQWQVPLFSQDYLYRWIEGMEWYCCNEQLSYLQLLVYLTKPDQANVAEAKIYMSLDEVPFTDRKKYRTDYSIIVWHWRKLENKVVQPFGNMNDPEKWKPGETMHDVQINLGLWKHWVEKRRRLTQRI